MTTTAIPSAEELFQSHIRLVYSSLRFYRPWLSRHREDLIQVAMLGLWEAVTKAALPSAPLEDQIAELWDRSGSVDMVAKTLGISADVVQMATVELRVKRAMERMQQRRKQIAAS